MEKESDTLDPRLYALSDRRRGVKDLPGLFQKPSGPFSLRCTAKSRNFLGGSIVSEVVACLEIEPELGCRIEGLGEQPRGFRGNAPLCSNQLVDALHRYAQVLRKGYLGLTQGNEELFEKNLSRVGRYAVIRPHGYPLW
jgi:hypothetical protein